MMDARSSTADQESWQARDPRVFVVIPTFNEAQNLEPLFAEIFSLPIANLRILIVDDNSPDGTADLAIKLCEVYGNRISVIRRPGKQGLGSAYRQGFRYALEHGADYVVQMDADFSHSPHYITQFLDSIQQADVVVGSRYMKGSQLDPRWSWTRVALSKWANSIYVRLILGLPVTDATGGYKLWSRRALNAVLAYPIASNGFVFQVEMGYLAHKLGFRTAEVPIYFEDRRNGDSKMSGSIKWEAMWRTWYLRWQYRAVHALSPSDPAASLRAEPQPAGIHTRVRGRD